MHRWFSLFKKQYSGFTTEHNVIRLKHGGWLSESLFLIVVFSKHQNDEKR